MLTGVSRNTIKRYLLRFDEGRYTYEAISQMTDHELEMLFGNTDKASSNAKFHALEIQFPELSKQLKRKGMTLLKLWEQYHAQYPDGYRRSQFCHHFHQYVRGSNPVMHLEHKAGDKMYIDFAGDQLAMVNPHTGEEKKVEVFAAILGCSQLTYVEAVYSQKSEDLINVTERAFHYFGGVTAAIVPDNLKSAVTRSSKYEPQINETFADFAEHYGTSVIPARAYRPRDKSLVEGIIKIIYTRIYTSLRQRPYTSLAELNAALWILLEELNNAPLKGRDYSRRQQFEELERAELHPLPAYRYELKRQLIVTVMKNGHVGLTADKHYYSVPFRFIGKKVKILYTSAQVEVFYRYERIAVHTRNQRKYQYTTVNEHLASAHRYLSDWSADKFIEQAKVIHANVAAYICKVIDGKAHPEQAYKSCSGILSLVRKVGAQRLINACRRADQYNIYNYPIIVQILDKKLDVFSPESEHINTMPDHDNIRGGDYYQ